MERLARAAIATTSTLDHLLTSLIDRLVLPGAIDDVARDRVQMNRPQLATHKQPDWRNRGQATGHSEDEERRRMLPAKPTARP